MILTNLLNKFLFGINNQSNEESGWVIESADAEYVNITIYRPLSESTYIKLPRRLRNSVKGLINIKNNDNKCFLQCHIVHINPLNVHPERIKNPIENG